MKAWIVIGMAACTGTAEQDPTGETSPGPTSPTVDPVDLDTDGDGLTDADELALGTDPAVGDTDVDRLGDADEVALGTDPLAADSDVDGYFDGDEVNEGSDPLDGTSWIYAGGWPYNPFKADLNDPGFPDNSISVGAQFPDLVTTDQYGQAVHLYDFANHDGRPILLDLSTVWCGPCNDVSAYLAGISSASNSWVELPATRDAIAAGEVHWITILLENDEGGLASPTDGVNWATAYENDQILVYSSPLTLQVTKYTDLYFYPNFIWLNADMTVHQYDAELSSNTNGAFEAFLAGQ